MSNADPSVANVAEYLDAARTAAEAGTPQTTTIRSLVQLSGAHRRGQHVVAGIRRELRRRNLTTEPDFAKGWIDDTVKIVAHRDAIATDGATGTDRADVTEVTDVRMTVGQLPSATAGLESVDRNEDLIRARTLMLANDYSQLGVTSGSRNLVGVVSWESIAKAAITTRDLTLARVTEHHTPVRTGDDLLPLVPRIIEKGFVIVADAVDRSICGIVTTADLSQQFVILARPFFQIGEAERRLRHALNAHFTPGELAGFVNPQDSARSVASADDLTLGEIQRIVDNPDHWQRICWPLDRRVFVEKLNGVRELRNELMHFSSDAIEEDRLAALDIFVQMLRTMDA